MPFLMFLFILVPWSTVSAGGCQSAVLTSAQVTIISERFRFMGYLDELEAVRRFAESLESATHEVKLILYCYNAEKLSAHIGSQQALGTLTYTVTDKVAYEYMNSLVWQPSAGRAHVLVLLDEGFPFYFMEPKLQKLRRAGTEIFVMGYSTFRDYDLDDIASYPAQTHSFSQLQYPNTELALSDLARSVCRSLEAKEQHAKKQLLSQVRLSGGSDRCQGRVEVLYNNTWGWLSDRHWDRHAADVICRQLRCGPSVEALGRDAYGPSPGPALEKLLCTGNEHDISQCLLGTWTEPNLENIQHSAGVSCLPSGLGDVRLVNGSGACDGIVEVSLNNTWNRLCLWDFDLREASVVCRQLGCGPLLRIQETVTRAGSEVRMVEKTHCLGAESRLSECSVSVWREEPCFHGVHAGVVCSPSGFSNVTLTGGIGTCSGKVKVRHNNRPSSVCADHWTTAEEAVLCKEIGCGPAIEQAKVKAVTLRRGENPQTDVHSVYCGGHEASLSQCASVLSGGSRCDSEEAEVLCSNSGVSQVRLVDGDSRCAGRVEVFYKDQWGTVCDKDWDLADASVVCRQVGCGDALRAAVGGSFGPGSGQIWLEKMFCDGSESAVAKCGAVISRKTLCVHSQDAGVVCAEKKTS